MEPTGGLAEKVYQNFWAFHQSSHLSGEFSPWVAEGGGEVEVNREVRELLESPSPPGSPRFRQLDFYPIARDFVGRADPPLPPAVAGDGGLGGGRNPFPALGKAFEILELIAVNLLLCPWRKEIRSLKTFTGAFVYFLEPAFPAEGPGGMLGKLGYSRRDRNRYVMVEPPGKEVLGRLAFEFLLARGECQILGEILERGPGSTTCLSAIQARSQPPLSPPPPITSSSSSSPPPPSPPSPPPPAMPRHRPPVHQPPLQPDCDEPLPLTDPPNSQPDHPVTGLPASLSDSIDLYTEYPDIHMVTVPVTPDPRLTQGPLSLSSFPDSHDPTLTEPDLLLRSREREAEREREGEREGAVGWQGSARRYPAEVWLAGEERLSYPIAETLGPEPALPHRACGVGVGGGGEEDGATRCPITEQVGVCPIAERGVCPITGLGVCPVASALLADACRLGSGSGVGGQEVREPPQSYYIPQLGLASPPRSPAPACSGDREVTVMDCEEPFVLLGKSTEISG